MLAGESANLVLGELSSGTGDEQVEKLRALVWQVGCSAEQAMQALGDYETYSAKLKSQVENIAVTAKLTNRITLSMPFVTVAIGQWSGLNFLSGLLQTTFGWFVTAIAATMIWLASQQAKRILERELKVSVDPGFDLQLAAIAMRSGLRRKEAAVLFGVPEKTAAELSAEAIEVRARTESAQLRRLALLPQKLLLNTGLLVMPATLLLTLGSVLIAGLKAL